MPKRDHVWSTYIHLAYGGEGPVDRLIDWAWPDEDDNGKPEDKSHIAGESIRLAGTALAWFLTTSNRFLRDRATKALVRLFEGRIPELARVLHSFRTVNDPYVAERLYAVAYGCAMRSGASEPLRALALAVLAMVFAGRDAPPHILLRDYARGVVERAVHLGLLPAAETSKARGPFKSKWPKVIPTAERLELLHVRSKRRGAARASKVWFSLTDDDFDHYVLKAALGNTGWRSTRLESKPGEDAVARLAKELPKRDRDLLDRVIKRNTGLWSGAVNHDAVRQAESELVKSLTPALRGQFEESVLPSIHAQSRPSGHEPEFNKDLLRRWVFQRVIQLGWHAELFEKFDDSVPPRGRSEHKAERIGKKYQWIAYHEALARLADNFRFTDEFHAGGYDGPWQMHLRDIDPSFCRRRLPETPWWRKPHCWWFPGYDAGFDDGRSDLQWLRDSTTLPKLPEVLRVRRPSTGDWWYVLSGHFAKGEEPPPGEDTWNVATRDVTYLVQCFVVKAVDASVLVRQFTLNFQNVRWSPDHATLHEVFLGEYPWSPGYLYQAIPYYLQGEWSRGNHDKLTRPVLSATVGYLRESSGYDCSLEENAQVEMPAEWLADKLDLRWTGEEGVMADAEGQVRTIDPSLSEPGPSSLLLSEGAAHGLERATDHTLLWTFLGEKIVLGGSRTDEGYIGRLVFGGACRLSKGALVGKLSAKFYGPGDAWDQ